MLCEFGCTSTSSNAIFWINTGSLSIGASSYATVNMIFEPTSTEYSGVHAGEAPQLSSTYAQYDNGANVFSFYQAFGGLSSLPSGWSSYSSNSLNTCTITYNPTNILINPPSGVGNCGIYKSYAPTTPIIYELYGNLYNPGNGAAASEYSGLASSLLSGGYGLLENGGGSTTKLLYYPSYATSSYVDSNSMKLYQLIISSATTVQEDVNYVNYYSATVTSYTPAYIYGIDGNYASIVSYQYLGYMRTRAYPPDGVMPTVQLSSVQSGDILSSNTQTIYMNFLSSNSPVSSGYTGYAPQLYCASGCAQSSYAQYDNGGSVFSFYDASPTGSKWTTYGSGQSVTTSANNGDYFKTTNALVTTLCGGGYTTNVDLNSISNDAIVTFWLYAGTSGNGGTLFFPSTSTGDSYGVGLGTGTGFETGVLSNRGGTVNPCDYAESTNGYYSQNTWYQNQLVLSGNTVSYYLQQSSSSTGIESFGTKIGSYQYGYTPSGNYITIGSMYPNFEISFAFFSSISANSSAPSSVILAPK